MKRKKGETIKKYKFFVANKLHTLIHGGIKQNSTEFFVIRYFHSSNNTEHTKKWAHLLFVHSIQQK